MAKFSYETFQNLFRNSPEKAFAYRDGLKTQETATTIKETTKEDTIQAEVVENTSEAEQVSFTRADLEQKLKDAGIKFSHLSKDETLLQKCIENNLI